MGSWAVRTRQHKHRGVGKPRASCFLETTNKRGGQTIWWIRFPKAAYGAGAQPKSTDKTHARQSEKSSITACSMPSKTAVALQVGPFTIAPPAEEVPAPDETAARTSAAPANYRLGYYKRQHRRPHTSLCM